MVKAEKRLLLVSCLLVLTVFIITACMMYAPPNVAVGSVTLSPGETGRVRISIYAAYGFQSIQVGPNGAFTYDPDVIEVEGIDGVDDFRVFASKIDNATGKVIFAAGFPGGSINRDGVVELEIKAVGNPGDMSSLEITQIDVLADKDYNDIGHTITPGVATIS